MFLRSALFLVNNTVLSHIKDIKTWLPASGNERKEKLRVEMPFNSCSIPRPYVKTNDESAPPPLPARKNQGHFSGLLQSPTSPQLFPRSPKTSPRHTPRSSPLVSPNLSPEGSPHASPRFPRHRHNPVEMLAEEEDVLPPKLPARSKAKQSRNKDHINNPIDVASNFPDDETHGRFPYSGLELSGNKKPAVSENPVPAKTNYAELNFLQPEIEKRDDGSRTNVGPRLSINDHEIEGCDDEPRSILETSKKPSSDEGRSDLNENDFCVHEDPFEGFNPFLEEKAKEANADEQRNRNVFQGESVDIGSQQIVKLSEPNVDSPFPDQTSKSLEDLSISNNDDTDTEDNCYMHPSSVSNPELPRSFSNPTYGSNFRCKASMEAGQSKTFPPIQGQRVADTERDQNLMEFYEEDFQILMGQGYSRDEIKKALIIADNNFATARKILREYHGCRTQRE